MNKTTRSSRNLSNENLFKGIRTNVKLDERDSSGKVKLRFKSENQIIEEYLNNFPNQYLSDYSSDEKLRRAPFVLLKKFNLKELLPAELRDSIPLDHVKSNDESIMKQTMKEFIIPLSRFRFLHEIETPEKNIGLSEIPVQAFIGEHVIEWDLNRTFKAQHPIDNLAEDLAENLIQVNLDQIDSPNLSKDNLNICKRSYKTSPEIPQRPNKRIKLDSEIDTNILDQPKLSSSFGHDVQNLSILENSLENIDFSTTLTEAAQSNDFLQSRSLDTISSFSNVSSNFYHGLVNSEENQTSKISIDTECQTDISYKYFSYRKVKLRKPFGSQRKKLNFQPEIIRLKKINSHHSLLQKSKLLDVIDLDLDKLTTLVVDGLTGAKSPNKSIDNGSDHKTFDSNFKVPTNLESSLLENFEVKRPPTRPSRFEPIIPYSTNKDDDIISLYAESIFLSDDMKESANLLPNNDNLDDGDFNYLFDANFFDMNIKKEINSQCSTSSTENRSPKKSDKILTNNDISSTKEVSMNTPQNVRERKFSNSKKKNVATPNIEIISNELITPDVAVTTNSVVTNNVNINWTNSDDYSYRYISSTTSEGNRSEQQLIKSENHFSNGFQIPNYTGLNNSSNIEAINNHHVHSKMSVNQESAFIKNENMGIISGDNKPNSSVTISSSWSNVEDSTNCPVPNSTLVRNRPGLLKNICLNFLKFGNCNYLGKCTYQHALPNSLSNRLQYLSKDNFVYFYENQFKKCYFLLQKIIHIIINLFFHWQSQDLLIDLGIFLLQKKPFSNYLYYLTQLMIKLGCLCGVSSSIVLFRTALNANGLSNFLHINDLFLQLLLYSGETIEGNWNLINELTSNHNYEISIEHLGILLKDCIQDFRGVDNVKNVYCIIKRLADVNIKKAEKTFPYEMKRLIAKMFNFKLIKEANELLSRLTFLKNEDISSPSLPVLPKQPLQIYPLSQ